MYNSLRSRENNTPTAHTGTKGDTTMTIRTTKVIKASGETIYESTCTINGNTITGCQNPFPYIKRMMRKHGLTAIAMNEDGQNITMIVK